MALKVDTYTKRASALFNVPASDVTDAQRKSAKSAMFAELYTDPSRMNLHRPYRGVNKSCPNP